MVLLQLQARSALEGATGGTSKQGGAPETAICGK